MTRKETTEVFSVLMLAFPRAEMFKGGIAKLGPTIELWATCLSDIDFWTGQQATFRVCKKCTFPPTIAEFRAEAEGIEKELRQGADEIFRQFRSACIQAKTPEEFYNHQFISQQGRAVIDAMGGPAGIFAADRWDPRGIEETYVRLAKANMWLTDGVSPAAMRRLEAPK